MRDETHVARQKWWINWSFIMLHDKRWWINWSFIMSHDKSDDSTGVLSCDTTLFECLRHNYLNLRQVPMMWCHKPDLLLFKTIAGTGGLLSKHAWGILLMTLTNVLTHARKYLLYTFTTCPPYVHYGLTICSQCVHSGHYCVLRLNGPCCRESCSENNSLKNSLNHGLLSFKHSEMFGHTQENIRNTHLRLVF